MIFWLLWKSKAKPTFSKVVKLQGRGVLAAFATRFCLRHCVFLCKGTKLQTVRRNFMEESWFGFLIAGGLCSKPGRSLGERINLDFATAPGCLHSLSLGRHDRFGCLCNQFLPKTLRFSLQRHKSSRIRRSRILGIVCRFSLWNSARCFRIQRKLNSGALARGFW